MGNCYGISRLAIEFRDEDNTLADKRTLQPRIHNKLVSEVGSNHF